MIEKEKFYTVKQTADFLQVNSRLVYRLIENLSLPVKEVGFGNLIPRYKIKGEYILKLKK